MKYHGISFIHDIPGKRTIAYAVDKHERGVRVRVAMARCSDKDQYCRATGRDVACVRLAAQKEAFASFVIAGMPRVPENGDEWRTVEFAVRLFSGV